MTARAPGRTPNAAPLVIPLALSAGASYHAVGQALSAIARTAALNWFREAVRDPRAPRVLSYQASVGPALGRVHVGTEVPEGFTVLSAISSVFTRDQAYFHILDALQRVPLCGNERKHPATTPTDQRTDALVQNRGHPLQPPKDGVGVHDFSLQPPKDGVGVHDFSGSGCPRLRSGLLFAAPCGSTS